MPYFIVMDRILIVEDSDSLREVMASVLQSEGYEVDAVADAESALTALSSRAYCCVLSDFKLPKMNGLELLEATREISGSVPFIIMTAFGSIEIAVEAMKLGANDFISKPFEPKILVSMISDVVKHRRIIDRTFGLRTKRERSFLTDSPSAQKLLHQARKVAKVDTSVLILGESGTGKELIARFIHEQSARKDKPFVAVNCAALPEDLLESEFFGHEAGSFTGATQTRVGVFEIASEGTIFLDEIGDMPLPLQVKLLRALQEREIKRIGSNKTIKVNPRVIAATHVNLEEALRDGRLRQDFYYRIAVVSLTIPPLRDRARDIDLLTKHYIEYFGNNLGRHAIEVDSAAMEILKSYGWPGNARELENVIERAVILADQTIRPEHLGISFDTTFDLLSESQQTLADIAANAAKKAEVEVITRTLAQTAGNKTKAAQLLGVSYKTLLNKVKEYKIPSNGGQA